MKIDAFKAPERLVFILILILAFLIGYNGIYGTAQKKIELIKLKTIQEKKKNEILKTLAVIDARLSTYRERTFSTTDITQVIDKISGLAKQAGVSVETFNPQTPAKKTHYTELALQIPLSCSYHRLGEFFSLLESNSKFIWVKQLKMEKIQASGQAEPQAPKITMSLSGIYLKK
ncbi:type 4a pilus biogenesis protein PilO [Candidatus Omnitrophota bacterium]